MASQTTKNVKALARDYTQLTALIDQQAHAINTLTGRLAELELKMLFLMHHISVRDPHASAIIGADGKPQIRVTNMATFYAANVDKFLEHLEQKMAEAEAAGESTVTP